MTRTELYKRQTTRWPANGQHILAQFDDSTIVVYQAYRREIGNFASTHQYFGGDFKLSRMSWIKTNFLWMMYRCGWGTKEGQEVVLAVTIRRKAFDKILGLAIHSSFSGGNYVLHDAWRQRLEKSSVRLQWDPDHDPFGGKQERRAIQLGLSGDILRSYSKDWIVKIEDISEFVRTGREKVKANKLDELLTPTEEVYPVRDAGTALHPGITDDEHPQISNR